MTQSWWNVPLAVFPPCWSISTEWFFYFAFIPLAFVARRIARPAITLAIYCISAALAAHLLLHLFKEPLTAFVDRWLFIGNKVSTDAWSWIIYMGPPLRLLEFVAGMLAAKTYITMRTKPTPRWVSVVLVLAPLWCAAVILAGSFWALSPIVSNFIFAPALAPLMVCVCLSAGRVNAALSSRPLLFMGEISYSVYLWSFFVITMLGSSFHSTTWSLEAGFNSVVKVVFIAGLTTVVAYGSFLLIEVPARRWLRTALGGSQARRRVLAPGE
jgi:peptidoglycan/LPS O-acetylase OafA/YrhL